MAKTEMAEARAAWVAAATREWLKAENAAEAEAARAAWAVWAVVTETLETEEEEALAANRQKEAAEPDRGQKLRILRGSGQV